MLVVIKRFFVSTSDYSLLKLLMCICAISGESNRAPQEQIYVLLQGYRPCIGSPSLCSAKKDN